MFDYRSAEISGVCDRHNDNIMIARDGRLFHVDYSRFLGNSQVIGGFKRDRVPFVLTTDMVYVINEGEKMTPAFDVQVLVATLTLSNSSSFVATSSMSCARMQHTSSTFSVFFCVQTSRS
jgi:hypothetical protein